MNRIPGVNFLARKRENFYLINRFKAYFMEDRHKYFPETFLIPEDYDDYVETHKSNPKRTYISKVNKGSQGYGITLIRNPKELSVKKVGKGDDMIVQRYIARPLLLKGKKHDLRLYVNIVSVEPFYAYLNEEGLARFCTVDYEEPNAENYADGGIHLTNYSQNKTKDGYVYTSEVTEINEGSKRTLESYWKSLEAEGMLPDEVRDLCL